jgi:lipoprotein-anchoring transpeptidase ErfK/SrfK
MRRLLIQLSGLYLVAVTAFCGTGVVHERPDWAHAVRTSAIEVNDAVSNWTRQTAASVHNSVTAWLDDKTASEPSLRGTQLEEQPEQQTAQAMPPPAVTPVPPQPAHTQSAPTPTPDSLPLRTVRITPERQIPRAQPPKAQVPDTQRDLQVAQAPVAEPAVPHAAPHADDHLPPADQIARVRERLRASLSSELYAGFDLFLYVSKADHGPWAQHMYVFAKDADGLRMLHAWPVSTGREDKEIDMNGDRQSTETPAGYYQLDPGRMLRHYTSVQWNAPMPFAMFFNWIDRGNATGLAIHGVEGQELTLLGTRASAGCIRLAPDAAKNLFNLIKDNYRGLVPRFAMDRRRSSMSNRGELMHDGDGELVRAQGYRVLVYIDGYGGDDMVSALY